MANTITRLLGIFQSVRRSMYRLTGKTPEDQASRRVVEGTAWFEFCDQLKSAGAALVYPGAPRDAFNQAEGIRYLSRLTRAALEAFVEYGDPLRPEFRRMVHETIKMGADNPDNYYMNAQIEGSHEYIIRGNRNSIHYLGIFTQNGNYGTTGGMTPCGVIEDSDISINPDGTFEIHLSHEPKGVNWLKTEPETGLVIVRQTFLDRNNEVPAELTIEPVRQSDALPWLTPAKLDSGLRTAGLFVAGAPLLFARWASGFQKHINELPLFDPEKRNHAGGDANILYYHSYWQLSEDEVLVIETSIPACDMWNFQLNNHWMESLDYRYSSICINSHTAIPEDDGSVLVVVSHTDPGHPNWIETCGHRQGTMCWRWYRPAQRDVPQPQTHVKKLNEFAAYAGS